MGKRLCICGPGRSGKDTIAEWLGNNTSLKYVGGTSWFAAERIYNHMISLGHKYRSVEECWEDRIYHRVLWADYIDNVINRDDPCTLYKMCLEQQDILTGIRRIKEIQSVKKLYNCLTIWVERKGLEVDLTMGYGPEECDLIITNNGNVSELFGKLGRFKCMMGI